MMGLQKKFNFNMLLGGLPGTKGGRVYLLSTPTDLGSRIEIFKLKMTERR